MAFNIFNKEKLPRDFRKIILPRKKFLKEAKGGFLAAYDNRYRHIMRPASRFSFVYRLSVSLVALMAVATAGVSVYADNQNVPADSPLYPLKRFSENVQVVLASPQDKPQLQARLAARRGEEIARLEEKDGVSVSFGAGLNIAGNATGTDATSSIVSSSSGDVSSNGSSSGNTDSANKKRRDLIFSLTKDLHEEIDNSINDADKEDLQDGKLADFCDTLGPTIASSSVVARGNFSARSGLLQRFENRCGQGAGAGVNATSSVNATSGVSNFPNQNRRGGDKNNFNIDLRSRIFGKQTSTVATSTGGGNNDGLFGSEGPSGASSSVSGSGSGDGGIDILTASSTGHVKLNKHDGGND